MKTTYKPAMVKGNDWTCWVRRLHESHTLSCELYVVRNGERLGWDDHYLNTYWNETEAMEYANRLLAAPRGEEVDIGYGIKATLPR